MEGRREPPYFLSVSMMADKESSKETFVPICDTIHKKQVLIMETIRQNGKIILHGNDGISIKMIFRNLTGQNFQGKEYADYIRHIAINSMGFTPGSIEHCRDGGVIDTGTIPNV